ncbi:MAG: hypothetical protein JO317_03505 [Verrucomicrobiae bacterium]|nr:hypothetical protein [Verrucomicrobiae bacterium]
MSKKKMITKITGRCSYPGCRRKATDIAVGRGEGQKEPRCYCRTHAEVVEDTGSPEYVEHCPNCGCRFGVN